MTIQETVGVGNDCTFMLDDFGNPKVASEAETIKNVVMFILFMKPGQYPSLPTLGMDIQNMLYSYYDDWNESDLENTLVSQCQALAPYINRGDIAFRKMKYKNMPSLLIHISTSEDDRYVQKYLRNSKKERDKEFFVGLSVDEINNITTSIKSV